MRESVAGTGADHRRRRLAIFVVFVSIYVGINLLARWLRVPLFEGYGLYGWSKPGAFELTYLALTAGLPVAVWSAALYLLTFRLPRVAQFWVAVVLSWVGLILLEANMAWYAMSLEHLTWRDIHMALTEGPEHFGLRVSDLVLIGCGLGGYLALVVVIMWLAGVAARRGWIRWLVRFRFRTVLVVLSIGVVVDSWVVASNRAVVPGIHNIWLGVPRANPLRLAFLDQVWIGSTAWDRNRRRATVAMQEFARRAPSASIRPPAPTPAKSIENVVVLVGEGLNPNLVDEKTMPFFYELSKRSLRLMHHYSTGNCTHYGLLGLLYGRPPTFYRGEDIEGIEGSRFIDTFEEKGFSCRYVGSNITIHRHIGAYLTNFSRPIAQTDDWGMVPVLGEELARGGKHFVLMFFNDTHFPYRHESRFTRFEPEVPKNFSYHAWGLEEHADEIKNRYRNCLLEMDAWIKAVVDELDMEKTILVITGDHGEAFFEGGRIGHSSSLEEPQIRVPCLIHVPGGKTGTLKGITSHADIMPTLMDALGWKVEVVGARQSVLRDYVERGAVVAYNNHTRPAYRWAVITPDTKTVLEETDGGVLRTIKLLDLKDEVVEFESMDERWAANFQLVDWLQRQIAARGR